ncbi:dnapol [Lambdina fiscellaria nucleopolyhedrovirus]|uniref:DNA-directed DNA polymerase n=1 Tax=Lambdina fiscellaria nucleopolyhedrovirus TaxID=1642929 RepID=A0A0E3Z6S2_9ABAC|nr:dnapol [Lambdina fiscellaria nucleopolyhedrovirus]AKC91697.1 dnapol [Lambdina fiscellaria nucleopolyhedrovirus]
MKQEKNQINLMNWQDLKRNLKCKKTDGLVTIEKGDVFRITRMVYTNNFLTIFLTGYTSVRPNQVYQFYAETKCNLYSYRMCYNNHVGARCHNKCASYKAFVMPGLRNVYTHKHNVVKYKRDGGNTNDRRCLDYFLKDINRVHMQTDLIEGQYVRFNDTQQCKNHRLLCSAMDTDSVRSLFRVVPVEDLTREIVPVILCYDIETHSDGQRFSNADTDHVMSMSLVVRRDNADTRLCFYYINGQQKDDLSGGNDDDDDDGRLERDQLHARRKVIAVRFDTELQMLTAFFDILPLLNPDYVLDYNGDKFDLPFIIKRIEKTLDPSLPINKMRSSAKETLKIRRYDLEPASMERVVQMDKFKNIMHAHYFVYYVHVDLYRFMSTDSEQKNLENFQLNTVCEHYLNRKKVDLSIAEMLRLYNSARIRKIIDYNIEDSVLPIDLFIKLEIMDFMYTQCMLLYLCTDDLLCNISHKINIVFFHLSLTNTATLKNGRTVADPYFFNRHDLKITSGQICQGSRDNTNGSSSSSKHDTASNVERDDANVAADVVDLTLLKRKPIPVEYIPKDAVKLCGVKASCSYKGGKVLEPQPGLEQWVATLDFNSLYLTIMMYEGACFSNIFVGADNNVYLVKNQDAINPKLLRNLLNLRSQYKSKRDKCEQGAFQYNLNDKAQNAVKRIANSIYGYFGIFFKVLANYITSIGRSKLAEAIERIEAMSGDADIMAQYSLSKLNFKVIYGDTDSSFIQVDFVDGQTTPERKQFVIERIIKQHVLKRLNEQWVGYKMSLENVMPALILLKKKKYCYINSADRVCYKGWLVKKDMPLFMRKSFRAVVDSYLRGHSVACGLELLHRLMSDYYHNFSKKNDDGIALTDYSFSMSYNEKSTSKRKNQTKKIKQNNDDDDDNKEEPPAKKVCLPHITIAKHCCQIMQQSGVKNLPGNGDRVPYLLIDIKGKITEKAYPLALFEESNNPTIRVNWIKHMGILNNFLNELIQVFGNKSEFEHYYELICALYMSEQVHDVKYPVLVNCSVKLSKNKKKKNVDDDDDYNNDGEDDDDNDDINSESDHVILNYDKQFRLYVRKPKSNSRHTKIACVKCLKKC